MHDMYEHRARANIEAELASLRAEMIDLST